MKKIALLLPATVLAFQAFANEGELVSLHKTMDEVYQAAGDDNNYISEYSLREHDYHDEYRYSHTITSLVSKNDLKTALHDCVFFTQGAYGEHLSNGQAWKLAGQWAKVLKGNKDIVRFERIDGEGLTRDGFAIFSSKCALALIDNDDDVLLMQGVSFD